MEATPRRALAFLFIAGSTALRAGEEAPPCPEPGSPDHADTHCAWIEVIVEGLPEGVTLVRAAATDETGDPVFYLFTATPGDGTDPVTVGPTAESEVQLTLPDGSWTFTVTASDRLDCPDAAPDAACTGVRPELPRFRRGDTNADGKVDISDAFGITNFLFLVWGTLPCPDAADADDSGSVNLTDSIRILNVLFLGVGTIPPPGLEECGIDPTLDDTRCFREPDC